MSPVGVATAAIQKTALGVWLQIDEPFLQPVIIFHYVYTCGSVCGCAHM